MGSLDFDYDEHVPFQHAPEPQMEHFRECSKYLDSKFRNQTNHKNTSFLFTIAPIQSVDRYSRDCVGNTVPILDDNNHHQIDLDDDDIPVFRWKAGSITQAEGYKLFQGREKNGITDGNDAEITQLTSRTRTVFSSSHDLSIVSAACDASRSFVSYSECTDNVYPDKAMKDPNAQETFMFRRPIFQPQEKYRSLIITQRKIEDPDYFNSTYDFVPGPDPCCIPAFLPSSLQACIRSSYDSPRLRDQYIRGDLGILLGTMMFSVNIHEEGDLSKKIKHADILERVFLQGKDGRLPKWYKSVWTDMSVADGFCYNDIQTVRGYIVYFSQDPENMMCSLSQVETFFTESESYDEKVCEKTRPFIYMRRGGYQSHQEVEEPLAESDMQMGECLDEPMLARP